MLYQLYQWRFILIYLAGISIATAVILQIAGVYGGTFNKCIYIVLKSQYHWTQAFCNRFDRKWQWVDTISNIPHATRASIDRQHCIAGYLAEEKFDAVANRRALFWRGVDRSTTVTNNSITSVKARTALFGRPAIWPPMKLWRSNRSNCRIPI